MAAGQAIVTCNGTGCPEVVGDDALLVPPRRPEALAAALSRLVQDDELRVRLGQRARTRVEHEFGWQGIARRHIALYRELSHSRAEPRRWGSWVRGSAVVGSRAPQRPR
jgi:glycosyltransferase involved in cell wall biosynthesis